VSFMFATQIFAHCLVSGFGVKVGLSLQYTHILDKCSAGDVLSRTKSSIVLGFCIFNVFPSAFEKHRTGVVLSF
jgi:hypothetical protein